MDTIDRSHSNLPAQFSSQQLSPLPSLTPALPFDQTGATAINFGPKLIKRGLTRQWKLIFIAWLVLSVPTVLLIFYNMKPTYEAFSTVLIEPVQDDIFGSIAKNGIVEDRSVTYLQTQVIKIASNTVLEQALHDALVVDLPTVKTWADPVYDLRKRLKVGIVGDTNVVRVALELTEKDEAIAIVRAVVQAYELQNKDYGQTVNRLQTDSYEQQLEKIKKDIKNQKDELEKLIKKGKVKFNSAELFNSKSESDPTEPTFKTLPENHLQRMISETYQTDLELFEAKSMLEAKEAANQASQEASEQQGAPER